ncbi:MAG TPA: EamA family transporter [Candidatus Limnocylindrales bacterium]|nr:EamA family transporter [Candidatus Limnocylindrales bacterium]
MTALDRLRERLDWVLFGLLGFFWGSSYLFIKIGVATLPPLTLVTGRLAIGCLLLATVVRLAGEALPRDPRTYGHLVVMAVLNIVVPFSLITWGEQSIDSALAAILNATVPLFTIVFAALVLHDEPITVNRLAGLAVGFAGVVLLVGPGAGGASGAPVHASSGGGELLGEAALIGSSISYAAGNVYARRMVRGLRPMVTALFQVAFALLLSGLLAAVFEAPWTVRPAPEAVLAVVWLGLLGSGLAYLIFFRLLRDWGSTRTSLVAYLLPIVGIVLGVGVAGERIEPSTLVGTALVIGGVALVNARFGARRLFGRAAPAVPDPAAACSEDG